MSKNIKKYKIPTNKQELIDAINEFGISDFICTSSILDGELTFGIEIRTKDHKFFNFSQSVSMRPVLSEIEVLDCTTGDCYDVPVELGKVFDASKYDYNPDPDTEYEPVFFAEEEE